MEVKINAMCMNVPEEFRILSAEERAGMQFLENGEGEILQEEIDGETAEAFRCRYNAQGTDMSAESMITTHNGIHYYVHCYWRTEMDEESTAVIREILSNVIWLQ